MVTPCTILDKARNQTIFGIGFHNHCRYEAVSKSLIGLQTALSANQIEPLTIGFGSSCYGDGAFEADLSDTVDDFLEYGLIAISWIDDVDPVNGQPFY